MTREDGRNGSSDIIVVTYLSLSSSSISSATAQSGSSSNSTIMPRTCGTGDRIEKLNLHFAQLEFRHNPVMNSFTKWASPAKFCLWFWHVFFKRNISSKQLNLEKIKIMIISNPKVYRAGFQTNDTVTEWVKNVGQHAANLGHWDS